ncbi:MULTISPECIES: helix-turn-helix domain-containing protein [Pasteurellaceae]|uniref:XRE family transcriptional regulator n=2 Tax=Pasteurellaceae TaxID=712 RepID=A0A380TNP2_9PAST|nr:MULTISPECIES: helix-turn-helix domain-containing protein [Pasteurellaceae]MCI7353436.1 helix-turn-helix domain-containing protein [[Actinobacillus] rossii]MCT8720358.1 helix-turn-helix domain-containing protein [Glaesserella parasuis]MDO4431111.1 helix-turn-helix domain-containing protein [Lonepinella koalarum]UWZ93963.1 helix-turn-helix domain-containing protein [[Pasteurella] aerogenes]VFY94593.1 XRE family transcriptional regulator [Actinobacillus indolicus]
MSKLSVTDVDRFIGKRIQQRRKELGLTASALSEQIGIAQQQLSRYERGDNKINVSHLVEIATALDTSIGWFFIDCLAEDSKTTHTRKFIPVGEDEVRERLTYHMDQLSADERRGLLVFLDSLSNFRK